MRISNLPSGALTKADYFVIDNGTDTTKIPSSAIDCIPITYGDLVALRTGGNLVAGRTYRITNFVTTTVQEGTSSAGHQFDLLVVAVTDSLLSEVAKAVRHAGDTYFANNNLEAWDLRYCLDNDTARFAWADSTNGKGVIYYMKDEFGNECAYDFKNILYSNMVIGIFTTWSASGSGDTMYARDSADDQVVDNTQYYCWKHPGYPQKIYTTTTTPTTSSKLYDASGVEQTYQILWVLGNNWTGNAYTFSYLSTSTVISDASLSQSGDTKCYSNIIKDYRVDGKQILNRTVIFDNEYGYSYRLHCYDNVFDFGNHDNIFVGRNIQKNLIGPEFNLNLLHDFQYNSIAYSFCFNNVGYSFDSNVIDTWFNCNITNGRFVSNSISSYFNHNTVGQYFSSNVLGGDFSHNTIGNDFQYNSIANNFQNCTIGNYFTNNRVGNNCKNFITGSDAQNLINNISNSIIDGSNSYICLTTSDTSGSDLSKVHIGLGVQGSSSANPLVLTVSARGLAYETFYKVSGSTEILI